MVLKMSCAFATSLDSHEHARVAERLGYRHAWFYDSPALYPDVWTQLCRAGERTERIGLGPGVLVPALRHPMVNAAGIATLVSLVGQERVAVGIGSGFTGRLALGERPSPWSRVAEYIRVLRALLRGERARWDGAVIEMLHVPGFAPPRPIEVPFLVGAQGPKGTAVARELADGVFGTPVPVRGFDWSAVLTFGTVLADAEDPGSERVVAAAGHAAGVLLHFAAEFGRLELVPGGRRWAEAYEQASPETRHLLMHKGHLCAVNEHDRPFITAELLSGLGLALTAKGWREKLAELEQAGATEVVYQPAGPDIPRELAAFAEAVHG
ncbi:LLM class flavin-dependent oxidoreductase [Actinomadura scrupuli]|uniref:LLM class flavin-dependent oxidoreductase n=1 Tax=Actinomadura scrupuli TaxID=559629 RepID=UPI003D9545AE